MTARIQSPMHCVHCNTTETPLWRAGPAGPKTLCNACGVRWKKTGSVIPRAKRQTGASTNNHHTTVAAATTTAPDVSKTPLLRKRARPSSHQEADARPCDTRWEPGSTKGTAAPHTEAAKPRESVDPTARVAAASMPAPRPISVFRICDAQRSKYEIVFIGLMVVNLQKEGYNRSILTRTLTQKDSELWGWTPDCRLLARKGVCRGAQGRLPLIWPCIRNRPCMSSRCIHPVVFIIAVPTVSYLCFHVMRRGETEPLYECTFHASPQNGRR